MFERARAFLRRIGGTGEDRRAHTRHETDVATTCQALAEGLDMPARIRNVSQSGIKVVVPRPVMPGTMLRIQVPPELVGHHTTLLACVTNQTQVGPEEYALGCMFSLELSDSEMTALGGEKKASRGDAQRAWVRSAVKGTVAYRELPGDGPESKTADLVDLSPAGLGLLVDERLEAGSAIIVNFHRTDHLADRPMLACVVYTTDRSDGKWAVGCNFLHVLKQSELDELLLTPA